MDANLVEKTEFQGNFNFRFTSSVFGLLALLKKLLPLLATEILKTKTMKKSIFTS